MFLINTNVGMLELCIDMDMQNFSNSTLFLGNSSDAIALHLFVKIAKIAQGYSSNSTIKPLRMIMILFM